VARVIYGGMGVSLDGYVEDESGNFEWSRPGEEVHRRANEVAAQASAFLYGRRMYELMEGFWPNAAAGREEGGEVEAEFARAYVDTPRIVFSDSLESVSKDARLVRHSEAIDEVRGLKEQPGGPLALGGPGLAASLWDLIDEVQLWLNPVVVGNGKPFFPPDAGRTDLRLLEQTEYPGGVMWLRYERV